MNLMSKKHMPKLHQGNGAVIFTLSILFKHLSTQLPTAVVANSFDFGTDFGLHKVCCLICQIFIQYNEVQQSLSKEVITVVVILLI